MKIIKRVKLSTKEMYNLKHFYVNNQNLCLLAIYWNYFIYLKII